MQCQHRHRVEVLNLLISEEETKNGRKGNNKKSFELERIERRGCTETVLGVENPKKKKMCDLHSMSVPFADCNHFPVN